MNEKPAVYKFNDESVLKGIEKWQAFTRHLFSKFRTLISARFLNVVLSFGIRSLMPVSQVERYKRDNKVYVWTILISDENTGVLGRERDSVTRSSSSLSTASKNTSSATSKFWGIRKKISTRKRQIQEKCRNKLTLVTTEPCLKTLKGFTLENQNVENWIHWSRKISSFFDKILG